MTKEVDTTYPCTHGFLTPCKPSLHSLCRHCTEEIKLVVGPTSVAAPVWLHFKMIDPHNQITNINCATTMAEPMDTIELASVDWEKSSVPVIDSDGGQSDVCGHPLNGSEYCDETKPCRFHDVADPPNLSNTGKKSWI